MSCKLSDCNDLLWILVYRDLGASSIAKGSSGEIELDFDCYESDTYEDEGYYPELEPIVESELEYSEPDKPRETVSPTLLCVDVDVDIVPSSELMAADKEGPLEAKNANGNGVLIDPSNGAQPKAAQKQETGKPNGQVAALVSNKNRSGIQEIGHALISTLKAGAKVNGIDTNVGAPLEQRKQPAAQKPEIPISSNKQTTKEGQAVVKKRPLNEIVALVRKQMQIKKAAEQAIENALSLAAAQNSNRQSNLPPQREPTPQAPETAEDKVDMDNKEGDEEKQAEAAEADQQEDVTKEEAEKAAEDQKKVEAAKAKEVPKPPPLPKLPPPKPAPKFADVKIAMNKITQARLKLRNKNVDIDKPETKPQPSEQVNSDDESGSETDGSYDSDTSDEPYSQTEFKGRIMAKLRGEMNVVIVVSVLMLRSLVVYT